MRIKTFLAPDMQAAMNLVRDALGEHAVILSSMRDPESKGIRLTAAVEGEEEPTLPPPVTEPAWDDEIVTTTSNDNDVVRAIERMLHFHNVPPYLVQKICETTRYVALPAVDVERDISSALARVLEATYSFAPVNLDAPSFRYMLIGPPGIGKTLTVAKMAAQIVMDRQKAIIITTDNKRAGGVEQLSAFTTILGMELHVANTKQDLRRVLSNIEEPSRVIIDSAGINPYDVEELKELGEMVHAAEVEPILVAAAGADANEAEEIASAFSYFGPKQLIITRTDAARRLGSILTTASIAELSFANMSSSSRVVGEFRPLNASLLAGLLSAYKQEIQ